MVKDVEPTSEPIDWQERATSWRRRAEQMQLLANAMTDVRGRRALTLQAQQWARMADEAECLAQQWQRAVPEVAQKH
jgi:hypothetical protein